MQVTFKTILASNKPYNTLPEDQYLQLLQENEKNIYEGFFGIYLARKFIVGGQELYQPLIDVDGASELEGDQKISSAIEFTKITIRSLKSLGVLEHFRAVATGGTGFRLVSNLLFNQSAYSGFLDLMRFEMPHIHDLKPTIEVEIPHQILAYKGDRQQNAKELSDSHSTIIDLSRLEQDDYKVEDYFFDTSGRPDLDEVISLVRWLLLKGQVISDLRALGAFGKKLEEYQQISSEFDVNPFSYVRVRNKTEPIGLTVMKEMLSEKGISSKVEYRGRNQAISFQGFPCPVCGKSNANARAYPPGYQLYCFNTNCGAHNGMPLYLWAGIRNNAAGPGATKNGFDLFPPQRCVSLQDARKLITSELKTENNSLIVVTPGAGKTHSALQTIANMAKERIVIYAALNKALQKEAYRKISILAKQKKRFHLLQSREDSCMRKDELRNITSRGYSPSELLCSRCEYRASGCSYYAQRQEIGPGVYFVTQHMLQYLEDRIPNPDLIILDENLKAGLLLEETCTEEQFKSILKVLHGTDSVMVNHLLDLNQLISRKLVETGSQAMIFNGRRLTDSDLQETTVIEMLAKRMNMGEEDVHSRLESLTDSLSKLSRRDLYQQEVDLKAVNWIKGLCSSSVLSFVHINEQGVIQYKTKKITKLGYPDTPIKILDATGDASTLKPLVGRALKTVRADVAWNSKRVHIKFSTSRDVMNRIKERHLKNLLSIMLEHTASKKIMVLTYKAQEKRIIGILKKIDPSRQYLGFHFFGPRGINQYQNCDAVLVVGLPYPNLNSTAQDACILFPDAKDSEKRQDLAEAWMQWDLVQGIQRIRPIHKTKVEIVIASSNWPSILQEPDQLIDKSQSRNWKELAIKRLEPFVETFGFLNQDIGFLANVYVDSKSTIAEKFQMNLARLLNDFIDKNVENKSNYMTSHLPWLEDFSNKLGNGLSYTLKNCDKVKSKDSNVDNTKSNVTSKLISLLYIYYNKNLLKYKDNIFHELIELGNKYKVNEDNDIIKLSNTNQWAELLIYFKEKNPHFETFYIKLPHARGNSVKGVGTSKRVKEFYDQINALGVVGNIDISSYQTAEKSISTVSPIPNDFVSIYIPDKENMAYVGWNSELEAVPLRQDKVHSHPVIQKILENPRKKIITNKGKEVAKMLLSWGHSTREIIDVVLAEKIISNGELVLSRVDLRSVFKRHGLPEGLERGITVRNMYDVWVNQERTIRSLGLRRVFHLEKRVIWITAKMESAGISIDLETALSYHDTLTKKLSGLIARIRDQVPDNISLNDRMKIKMYVNSKYGLELAKIEDSAHSIENQEAGDLISYLDEYWKTKHELDALESYMESTGEDGRVRDSINQLNTKTGRFYRLLQTAPKDGPMRALFRAREGYKFIRADYSQQEARIIAGLANDAVAINLFKSGKDIYTETANLLLHRSSSPSKRNRSLGKEIMLGLSNGRSAYSIFRRLEELAFWYDYDDVMGFVFQYEREFEGITAWRKGIVSSAEKNGFISTKLGRRIKVNREPNINSLYNFPVQGTAADGFKIALILLDQELAGLDARIVHILHDEVIVEAKEGIAEGVAKKVKGCMEKAFKYLVGNVPFAVEPEIRDSWG